MQRFKKDKRVSLKVALSFSNPTQTLPANSKGTILALLSNGISYKIQFDDRVKFSIIKDSDLNP